MAEFFKTLFLIVEMTAGFFLTYGLAAQFLGYEFTDPVAWCCFGLAVSSELLYLLWVCD